MPRFYTATTTPLSFCCHAVTLSHLSHHIYIPNLSLCHRLCENKAACLSHRRNWERAICCFFGGCKEYSQLPLQKAQYEFSFFFGYPKIYFIYYPDNKNKENKQN